MPKNTTLLIIDPQIDFTEANGASLPVKGANADLIRLAAYIDANHDAITDIVVTLDTHELLDIGHPLFWRLRDGSVPPPFTQVGFQDVAGGAIGPAAPTDRVRVLDYLRQLEENGRYQHMIWPVHCQIGSRGHAIAPILLDACNAWEQTTGRPMMRVMKGMNRYTESYSAVRAEVPDLSDPSTMTNYGLLGRLDGADEILVAGEALSHCVKSTVEDLVALLRKGDASSFTLLTDAMSAVPGFESQGAQFLAATQALGAKLATTGVL